jgi:parallel beta-helix repeat protein
MALTKVHNRMISDAFVNVRDFGASSSASAADNLAAFNAAVTATPVGGTLYVPADGGEYVIDTTGGRSSAVLINKRMTVFIDGDVKANYSAIEPNAPTIFNVTADYVTFNGPGRVIGDGTVNQQNIGGDAPSLIYVIGSYFTMTEITIVTAPKIGLWLASGTNAKITNCNFTGGATQYEDTAYFAIRIDSGAYHIISNNQFFPDASGGMYVNCIFAIASYCIYDSNVCLRPYEKLIYSTGDGNVISNNSVIGNTGAIPGSNIFGTFGAVYRCDGGKNKVIGNYSQYAGGLACRFKGANTVADNSFLDCIGGGVAIFQGTSTLDYTSVTNNIMFNGNLQGHVDADGILLAAETGTNYQINVSGNTLRYFAPLDRYTNIPQWQGSEVFPTIHAVIQPTVDNGFTYYPSTPGTTGGSEPAFPTSAGATVADGTVVWTAVAKITSEPIASIRMTATVAKSVYCQVSNNIIDETNIGIYTTYMSQSIIESNQIRAGGYGIIQNLGTYNKYRFNVVRTAANKGIGSMDATSYGEGNTYDETFSFANLTLPAGATVANVPTSVFIAATSGASYLISPNNDAAADYIRDHGLYCTTSAPTVTVNSADGTNFVGTESVTIQIIQ